MSFAPSITVGFLAYLGGQCSVFRLLPWSKPKSTQPDTGSLVANPDLVMRGSGGEVQISDAVTEARATLSSALAQHPGCTSASGLLVKELQHGCTYPFGSESRLIQRYKLAIAER